MRGPDGSIAEPEGLDARAPTGVAGLDDMLGGGLPRASATVVQGGTGTGKTMLGLQFLLEGARQGEPGIHFALEETANQLRRIAQGFGWDLRPLEERGLLTFRYVSPVELSTDRFLQEARDEVARLGARRAVLDSLTSMALGVPSERRFKELVYAITKHFRAAGVTINMNMEISDLLGSAQLSGHGVSFAADNVIQLKYVEVDGRLERGISVLKARGVRHATDVRRLDLGEGRIEVTSAFAGLRGVLTGLPKPAKPPRRKMMATTKMGGGEMIGRTLYDVTQLLESADRADERVRRVLELLRDLVPYEQCALLEARLGHEERVVLVPEPSADERVVLTRDAGRHLRAARRHGRAHLRASRAGPRRRASPCRSWGSTR